MFLCKNDLAIKQTDELPVRLDAIINDFEYIFDDQTPWFKMADEISWAIKALCVSNNKSRNVWRKIDQQYGWSYFANSGPILKMGHAEFRFSMG